MRYLTLIFIVLALAYTWKSSSSTSTKNLETHVSIQEDLSQIIAQAVATYLPDAKDLKFKKLWTKSENENEIVAYFSYSFMNQSGDEKFEVALDGKAHMKRIFSSPSGETNLQKPLLTANDHPTNNWYLDQIEINNEAVQFEQPVVITHDPTQPISNETAEEPAAGSKKE